MFHAKFQNHRPSGSGEVFAINSHGGHLGHVTLIIYINFHSPLHDVWFWPVSEMFEYQRTYGPVNAHLRSAAYTNKHV